MRSTFLILALLIIAVAGCDQASLMKKMVSTEDEEIAVGYINLLRNGKFDQIEKDLDPSIRTPNSLETISKMAEELPAGEPLSIKVVGVNTSRGLDIYQSNITFEYEFSNKWFLINVAVQKKTGVSTIFGFHVNPILTSLEKQNEFTLSNKSILQYAIFGFAVVIPLFSLFALVACIRTKMPKRKWLWILFILCGVGKFSIDWATGRWGFMPLAFQLFGAGAFAPLYGAWTISVSFPLGAIIFLFRKRKLGMSDKLEVGPINTEVV